MHIEKHFGMDLRREMGLGIPRVPPESALHGNDSTNYLLVVIPVLIGKYRGISFVFWLENLGGDLVRAGI